jgi:hypothetical protein
MSVMGSRRLRFIKITIEELTRTMLGSSRGNSEYGGMMTKYTVLLSCKYDLEHQG